MRSGSKTPGPIKTAKKILAELQDLDIKNAAHMRNIRHRYSQALKSESAEFIIDVAREISKCPNRRWLAGELIIHHPSALKLIGENELEEFGQGINNWGDTDAFAGHLAGRAWRAGQIPDELIHTWARSEDRWWRRAALVATVPLNRKAAGGTGDTDRTLAVCRLLVSDRDDMVVKALSWALRDLIPRDAAAVERFLNDYEDALAARVKREVRNKLRTGLKNPPRPKNRRNILHNKT